MKMMLLKFMMLITMITSMMKTPMSMGIMLILYTTLSTILLSKIISSSWLSMIIFLMLIGGLLILFMYMSSIASNEKFTPNTKMLITLMLLFIPVEEILSEMQINEMENKFIKIDTISLTKYYNQKTMMITLMMFMYLLLAMIAVTKIIKIYKGPLRSK